jgi:hypothetical protein
MREDNSYSKDKAISYYHCIGCNTEIYLDRRFVDKKGRMIGLEQYGSKQHRCLWERALMQSRSSIGYQRDIQSYLVCPENCNNCPGYLVVYFAKEKVGCQCKCHNYKVMVEGPTPSCILEATYTHDV